ncbi:MAG: RNA polymerase sigma factor [Oscillospiraceae bacterium]|nr:RNA polymerase sigma factor [Oscillospiraceae bacterium]
MKEEKAIKKIREKDPEGLRALMDRYIPYVSAVVWNILRHAMAVEDAEEVVSDVFLAAWDQGEDLQVGKVKAWLGAVARNKAKNKLRKLGKELPLEEDLLELSDGVTPQDRLEQQEEVTLVRQAVEALPPKDREVFLRHYYYAQSVEEIAKKMKMPASTVKSRLRRGRMKLKDYLMGRDS